ncbi:MAG: ATP-binding protein [Oscillospiraceae bacterium]|nr:ATP-binding protein [Oscillospiraceae bacterium]
MSLKLKMTLWYTLLMLAIVGVVIIFVMTTANASAETAARNILQNIVEQNQRELWYSDGELSQYGFHTYQDGVYLMVYDMAEQLVLGTEPVELPEMTFENDAFGTVAVDGGVFYYYQVFVVSEESGGFFQATGAFSGSREVRGDPTGEPSGDADTVSEADAAEDPAADAAGTGSSTYPGAASGEASGEAGETGTAAPSGEASGEVPADGSATDAGGDTSEDTAAYGSGSYTVTLLSAGSGYRAALLSAASGEPSGELETDGVWLMGLLSADSVSTVGPMMFVALPLLVLLAALGGWFMAKKALDPVREIESSAREISGGEDLSRRIDLGQGQDEIHRLAGTINGMLDRLERSFQAERQFTSDASHELRTPTAVILAECELAEKTAAEREDFLQSLSVIERQGRKMSALISTLLAYTRREQGTEKLQIERMSLSELTEAICQELPRVNREDITLSARIQPGVFVRADSGLIMSLIQNLVTNAYKYGRAGGHIWVTLSGSAGYARLSVKDDGIGISEENQARVWNRFYQADPARQNQDGSLGLGLSMAQQIARLHGGRIDLTSQEGKGSEFVFLMPLDEG